MNDLDFLTGENVQASSVNLNDKIQTELNDISTNLSLGIIVRILAFSSVQEKSLIVFKGTAISEAKLFGQLGIELKNTQVV
jgi:hypothetical protein